MIFTDLRFERLQDGDSRIRGILPGYQPAPGSMVATRQNVIVIRHSDREDGPYDVVARGDRPCFQERLSASEAEQLVADTLAA